MVLAHIPITDAAISNVVFIWCVAPHLQKRKLSIPPPQITTKVVFEVANRDLNSAH